MSMDDRKKGFEQKFAMDEELRFKVEARRAKLAGLWVAEKLGMSGPEAEAYARTVVVADLSEAGEEDLFRKLRADLDAKKVDVSDHHLRRLMEEKLAEATEQFKTS